MAEFKTPLNKKLLSHIIQNEPSPSLGYIIPSSPCMKQLGYGTGVNVYLLERFSPVRGCYKSPLAVKKINRQCIQNEEYSKRLDLEAKILKSLKHPNIIGYRAFSTCKDGTRCLVMESGEKALSDLIEERVDKELGPYPANKILKVAHDIASALMYLHEEKHILHGDLKSANVLIRGDFKTAQLCDFGVTIKLTDKGEADPCSDSYYVGTECWSAPEALIGGDVSQKTDMFAYGLILWEMISLVPPHIDKLNSNACDANESNLGDESVVILETDDDEFQKALGTRPGLPADKLDNSYIKVLEIFYACTENNPSQRPTARMVLSVLGSLSN